MANLDGADAAYAKAHSVAARAPRKAGKGLVVALGFGLIAAPWLFVFALIKSLSDMDMTKGRVLRIKNRARLPELATGVGWSAPPVTLQIDLPAAERAVLGELWLLTARMEHASVAAFSQLSLHLSALGAPRSAVRVAYAFVIRRAASASIVRASWKSNADSPPASWVVR